MHPIERLRHVARAGGLDLSELAQEAAYALAGFADDPAALVTACRSLVDRHPAAGPVWWLAARVLTAADPETESWRSIEALERDDTARTLYRLVPDEAMVLAIGWTDTLASALVRRRDCRLLVFDATGFFLDGRGRPVYRGLDFENIPASGLGAAAACADVVLVEAQALGPSGLVGLSGARAALAVAAAAGRPTWAVAPLGRLLPDGLWQMVAERVGEVSEPWLKPDEVVPIDLVSGVVRPSGLQDPAEATDEPDCPFAPELVRPLDAPGSYR